MFLVHQEPIEKRPLSIFMIIKKLYLEKKPCFLCWPFLMSEVPLYRPTCGSGVCTGGPDVIRKEARFFYRTSSGVCLCWELEEPKGPKGRVCESVPDGDNSSTPFEDHPLEDRSELSALEGGASPGEKAITRRMSKGPMRGPRLCSCASAVRVS